MMPIEIPFALGLISLILSLFNILSDNSFVICIFLSMIGMMICFAQKAGGKNDI